MDPSSAKKRTAGLIALAGGPYALAAAISDAGSPIAPQAISQWTVIPWWHARAISRITGIPLYVLRPDIWEAVPPLAPKSRRTAKPTEPRGRAA